jgi:anti-sigma B factor antagonist
MALGSVTTEQGSEPIGLPFVVASGEVDLALAPALQEGIATALDGSNGVVVDLSDATFLDSVALGTLIAAQQRCEDSGATLYVIVSDSRVMRVFELTGLASSFAMFDSRAALTEHVSGAGSPA